MRDSFTIPTQGRRVISPGGSYLFHNWGDYRFVFVAQAKLAASSWIAAHLPPPRFVFAQKAGLLCKRAADLKGLVADLTLDKHLLQEVLRKKP